MKIIEKLTGEKFVCPWWLCFTFDNPLRKFIHSPEKILSPYIHAGNRVIDIGCGMGYFTIPIARLVGTEGHVTAIDIQAKMLSVLRKRACKNGVSERIETYLSSQETVGSHDKVDFILAFWMVHETPNQRTFFEEMRGLLKPAGLFLLVEPIIHVPNKRFLRTIEIANSLGFAVKETPDIRLSHSVLLCCQS